MDSRSHSQQSELMLNVSQQDDELKSPRLGYHDGEPFSTSSAAGSQKGNSQTSNDIQVQATQYDNFTGTAAPGTQGGPTEARAMSSPERIEDSFEPQHMARPGRRDAQPNGSPVLGKPVELLDAQGDHHDSDDDDDGMYSIGLAGKAKHGAAVSEGRNAKAQHTHQELLAQQYDRQKQDDANGSSPPQHPVKVASQLMLQPSHDDDAMAPGAKPRSAIDDLLDGGAVAGPSVKTTGSGLRSPVAAREKRKDAQTHGASRSAEVTSVRPKWKPQTRSTAPAAAATRSKKPTKASIPSAMPLEPPKGRLQRAAKNTAIAALRAKHDLIYSTQSEEPRAESSDEDDLAALNKKPAAASKGKIPDGHHLPTPLTNGSDSRNKNARATAGKLPTHISRATVAAVNKVKNVSHATSRKRKAAPESDNADDEEQIVTARVPAALKRPTKLATSSKSQVPRKDTYDVSDDELGVQNVIKAGDLPSRTLERPLKNSEPSHRVVRPRAISSISGPGKRSRSVSRASKVSTVKLSAGGRTRQRMQEESISARATPAPGNGRTAAHRRALQEVTTQDLNWKRQKVGEKVTSCEENVTECLADIPTVSNERIGASVFCGIDKNTGLKLAMHDGQAKAVTLERHSLRPPFAPRHDHVLPEHVQGDSQEEAIVIVDNSKSSSRATCAEPAALRQNQAEVQQFARDRPETPADYFRSSLTASQTAPAPVLESARPQIISFGANGPRNQGTISTRKELPMPAKSASNLPDTTDLDREETSSQASLHAERRDVPGTGISKSNVAAAEEDVFAAFTADGQHPKLSRILKQPGLDLDSKARHCQDQDEGFANIDDYEPSTLVDQWPSPNERTLHPTASQLAMPPPLGQGQVAKKASKLSNVSEMVRDGGSTSREPPQADGYKRKREETTIDPPEFSSKRAKPTEQKSRLSTQGSSSRNIPSIDSQAQLKSEASKRATLERSKSTRQVSQRSRQVDLQGSPFPRGMVVGDRATARETCSQYMDISSDRITDAAVLSLRATTKSTEMLNAIVLRPIRTQPEVMSSNTKPLPAAPHEESRAILRRASGAEADQLKTTQPTIDPFTTSFRDTQSSSERVRRPTAFQQKVQELYPEQFQQCGEDPDRTLVEENDDRGRRASKRHTSVSTNSSSDSSATSDKIDQDNDIAAWLDALKPHQQNLFNSLVVVSHKLVRYLVDQETAVQDLKGDLRRQGLQMIEEMERGHANIYEKNKSELTQKRRKTVKDLKSREKLLRSLMMQGTPLKSKEKSHVTRSWNETERILDALRKLCV